MSPLGRALALAAVLCPLASSADCERRSCDDTSFVQVKQIVKHGESRKENWPPTPVHDDYAITDSASPDDGKVTDAFDANMEKVKDNVEDGTARDLEFANTVRQERKADVKAAEADVASAKKSVKESVKKDQKRVAQVKEDHDAHVKAAVKRVDDARESAEAHAIKKEQTQEAAIAGSVAGAEQGLDEAAEAQNDVETKWAKDSAKASREAARAYLKKKAAEEKAAVDEATKAVAANEEAWAKNQGKLRKMAEEKSAADAAEAETAIEGPEGIENTIINQAADRVASRYARDTDKSKESIDEAAEAQWPKGNSLSLR